MLDFKISFRWGRVIYVGILSGIIAYYFNIIPALICLLSILDIRIDRDIFEAEFSDISEDSNNENYGPQS